MTAGPGWFPDPANQQLLRYWDGQQWTESTAPAPGGYGPPAQFAAAVPQEIGNKFSVWGIVFGCLAFVFCPILFGPLGIFMSSRGTKRGESLSFVALIVSIVGMVVGMLLGIFLYINLRKGA